MTSKFASMLGSAGGVLSGGLLVALAVSSALGGPGDSAATTYARKCAVCHGKDGAAQTVKGKKLKIKDVRVNVQKDSEEAMIKIVREGKGKDMDSFSDELSADEITAVVEYYRSLTKK